MQPIQHPREEQSNAERSTIGQVEPKTLRTFTIPMGTSGSAAPRAISSVSFDSSPCALAAAAKSFAALSAAAISPAR